MIESIEDRLEAARVYFMEEAEATKKSEKREHHRHLVRLAESVQETVRQLDYLKAQVEEMRHAVKL